ncbi:uncharacterized protein LOC142828061 [Pelodiscus sinensis]|uniref:uncharacterized protein LOC142828061 n=1 Tax=Pelodiscus sinensis TaxID=13735 RepID=UPI003F6C946B
MAEGLAKKGHHPRTLDRVQAKVEELRQGYARAREHSSTSGEVPHHCAYFQELDRILGGGEPLSALVLVQSGLQTPVQQCQEVAEDNPEQQLQEEEEEEDPNQSLITLTLQPVSQTQEISQSSSNVGQGTSAGPVGSDQHVTPMPPPTWSHGSRRHWRVYNDLMQRHVEALERMEDTLAEKMREEARWHDCLLEELLQQRTAICGTIREAMGFPGAAPFAAQPAPAPSAFPSSPSPPAFPSSPTPSAPPQPLPPPHPCHRRPSCSPPTVPGPTLPQACLGPRTRGGRLLWAKQHPQP